MTRHLVTGPGSAASGTFPVPVTTSQLPDPADISDEAYAWAASWDTVTEDPAP